MSRPQHPSYLELDRHSLGVAEDTSIAQHVSGCEQCRAHLAQVTAAESVPSWVRELRAPARPPRSRQLAKALTALALAAAASLLVLRAPSRDVESAYDTSKGAPSVWVHVQHDGVGSPWDGKPLSPGDRIRLELAPEEFRHVTVFHHGSDGHPPSLLFRSALRPHARVALDKAWELDDARTPERLTVLFARSELSVAAARRALRERDTAQVHAVELVLAKRSAP